MVRQGEKVSQEFASLSLPPGWMKKVSEERKRFERMSGIYIDGVIAYASWFTALSEVMKGRKLSEERFNRTASVMDTNSVDPFSILDTMFEEKDMVDSK